MRRIVTVVGARPQFIKASVVSEAIRRSGVLEEALVHTGQHFDENMSRVFFAQLGMEEPAYNLGIHGGRHGEMTGRMLAAIEALLIDVSPDAVLVYGDTNSTLAAALAAVKLQIPVAHVEAGLRSFNLAMPEEVNRILTDRVSRWLFTPTEAAVEHLVREGTARDRIFPVGDVMYDVALYHGGRVTAKEGLLQSLELEPRGYVLATVHRAENTDAPERIAAILDAINRIAADLPVVWPVHPRTSEVLRKAGLLERVHPGVRLLEPIGYLDIVQLEKYAALVATDSGGMQKEAFFFRVPCVTLRDETEWVELVDSGWNRLAPPVNADGIVRAVHEALGSHGRPVDPYGQGDAAARIVDHLATTL